MSSKEWAGVRGMLTGMAYGFALGVVLSRDTVRVLRELADIIDIRHRSSDWSSRKAG